VVVLGAGVFLSRLSEQRNPPPAKASHHMRHLLTFSFCLLKVALARAA
jgi:hypothetical protein